MKIYLVGGAVRDKLLNLPVSDHDYVVVGSSIEEMKSLGYKQVGNNFPVFLHPKTGFEYALARTEKKYGHGYEGFIFDFNPHVSLDEDLSRRDLTINAIAEDSNGNIIDPCGGINDLNNKILRHIGPSFEEDPLRVLRVARFAARFHNLGFRVADETIELMKKICKQGELQYLTPERVFLEFDKVMHKGNTDIFIQILRKCGALEIIFPEINALYGIPARKYWHPEVDTGIHMELCLKYATKNNYSATETFALFCHDFGKALTDKSILPSHHGHGIKGVPIITKFSDRLKVPNNYQKAACMVAKEHSFVHLALNKSNAEILELFKRIDSFRNPNNLTILLNCCKADIRGRLGFEDIQYLHAQLVSDLFLEIQNIKPTEIIKAGFKGKAIAEKLDELRINRMNEFRTKWNQLHYQEIINEKKEDPEWTKRKKVLGSKDQNNP